VSGLSGTFDPCTQGLATDDVSCPLGHVNGREEVTDMWRFLFIAFLVSGDDSVLQRPHSRPVWDRGAAHTFARGAHRGAARCCVVAATGSPADLA
jgi:hypothetical protein